MLRCHESRPSTLPACLLALPPRRSFMCRYFSGFFWRHPFLAPFDYYWRVEPHVEFLCNLHHDPFRYAVQHNISYGARRAAAAPPVLTACEEQPSPAQPTGGPCLLPFDGAYSERMCCPHRALGWNIIAQGDPGTVPTLWPTVQEYMAANPGDVPADNALRGVLTTDDPPTFNFCHFWSNFEIGAFAWLRSPQHLRFFEHLDRCGGMGREGVPAGSCRATRA